MKIEKVYRKDLKAWRWGFDVTISGRRIRRYEWPKKKDALDALAALHTKDRRVRYGIEIPKPKITLGKLQERAEKDKALLAQRETLRLFKHFVALIGSTTELTKLTKADWKTYVDSLIERDCKASTINRYLAGVCGVLSSALERFPDLGDWHPPKAPWLQTPAGRSRILSKEELSRLFASCLAEKQKFEKSVSIQYRREVYDLLRLILLTGAREGEILHLKQSQISWEWKTVRIESLKGGAMTRLVPLSNLALVILKSRIDHSPRFFTLTKWRLYNTLRRIAEISKVDYGGRIDGGWVCYDLRHVAATVMENSGIPYSAVSAILGHKRRDQTATYAHAQMETLRRGVEILESWCRDFDGVSMASAEKFGDSLIERKQR